MENNPLIAVGHPLRQAIRAYMNTALPDSVDKNMKAEFRFSTHVEPARKKGVSLTISNMLAHIEDFLSGSAEGLKRSEG